jgi:hypothetical protein
MRALYTLLIDILYVIGICNDLGRPIELPAIVLEDNQPVIDLTADLSFRSKKCKHFLMLVNYIKEQIEAGLIQLQKVDTLHNRADILTKIVVGNEFRRKSLELLGIPLDETQGIPLDESQRSSNTRKDHIWHSGRSL